VGVVVSDRYEITRLIGRGGWGTVYEAQDRQLAERVALKALMPARPGDAEIVLERFKSEIRLARRISHENVVRTHDFGESDGLVFVTMELVEGITVRHLLENRRRLGVASTLAIATQLARALDAAHRQGVIHRDIKPENILLDANGIAKVMDFGIAQFSQRPSRLTQSGTTLGTPEYMAPEQLLEDPVDERTDLYSAGVVLFECLTGRLPHQAQSAISLVAKILVEPCPDPATFADDIPPALSAVVLSLLAREKVDRPPSAARLLDLLLPLA
jgi:serine/threonine protein kinase